MWYEIASGHSHLSRRELGRALKKFTAVIKHFADIHEDQFDFHSYCIRKMTLRPYLAMLRMEDTLFAHPAYGRAAAGAVKTYLHIADFGLASSAGELAVLYSTFELCWDLLVADNDSDGLQVTAYAGYLEQVTCCLNGGEVLLCT